MNSEFLVWFVLQHGKREGKLFSASSDQQLRDDIHRGKMAAAELEARMRWDAQQQSALYAWQARDTPAQEER